MQFVSISVEEHLHNRMLTAAASLGRELPDIAEQVLRDFFQDDEKWQTLIKGLAKTPKPVDKIPVAASTPPVVTELSPPNFSAGFSALPTVGKLDSIMQGVLSQLGLAALPENLKKSPRGYFCAWSCLAVKVGQQWTSWLDFRLSMSPESVRLLYRTLLGETTSTEAQLCDAFSELLNMLQGSVKTSIEKDSGVVLMPFLPKAGVRATGWQEIPSPRVSWMRRLNLGGSEQEALDIAIIETSIRRSARKRAVTTLKPHVIMLEKVCASADSPVPLVNAGTFLNQRYVNRLRNLTCNKKPIEVTVVEPSAWAMDMVDTRELGF